MAMYQRTLSDMDSEDRTELLKVLRILLVAKRSLTPHELRFTMQGFPELRDCAYMCDGNNCCSLSEKSVALSQRTVNRFTVISGGLLKKSRNGTLGLCHETLGVYMTYSMDLDFPAEDTAMNLGHRYFVDACCRACKMIDTPTTHEFIRPHKTILGYAADVVFRHAVESRCEFTLLKIVFQSHLQLWKEEDYAPLRQFVSNFPD